MQTAALVPRPQHGDNIPLLAEVRELVARMVRRGHRPSSFVLVRLTDGRIKLVRSEYGIEQAKQELRRITNEYGPASVALSVATQEREGGLVVSVDDLRMTR